MTIRPAQNEDITSILTLMRELAEFEGLEDQLLIDEERLHDALLGNVPAAGCFVGEFEGRIVAFAIFFPVFKSFRGQRSIYLEDLYVCEAERRRGFGRRMLGAVAAFAYENGFERLDWKTARANTNAIGFYHSLGAESRDTEVDFRLLGDALTKMAAEAS